MGVGLGAGLGHWQKVSVAAKGWLAAGQAVWLVAASLVGLPAQADPLLDFGLFDVPSQSQLAMKAPVVRWQVRPDAETACAQASPKDGYASRREGCAYWHLASNVCTLVTTAPTTHSQLGHLFLHCLQGK